MSDYPSGDGLPNCPFCRGRGVVSLTREERPLVAMGEVTRICSCVQVRDVKLNLERGWKGLSKAAPVKSSQLSNKHKTNIMITSTSFNLKQHIRHVAVRMGPRWNFLVVSDALLMDAWLSKGLNVYDPDIVGIRENERQKMEKSPIEALSELVEHPALLIVCLGVKAARNSAMSEVMLETLTLRDFRDKPTWVVDQPSYPLMEGHISYSVHVGSHMEDWEHIALDPYVGVSSMGIGTSVPGEAAPITQEVHPSKPIKPTVCYSRQNTAPTGLAAPSTMVGELDPDNEVRRMEEKDKKKKWGGRK